MLDYLNMKKIKVAVVGANGYVGMELALILWRHPNVVISDLTGHSSAGETVLIGTGKSDKMTLKKIGDLKIGQCQVIFTCLPHGEAAKYVPGWLKAGKTVFDLSADFRLRNPNSYDKWYHAKHPAPGLLKKAVYGLPEVYFKEIKKAQLIACPGCYPTATILGMLPAVSKGLVRPDIFVSAVSGVSGAGRRGEIGYSFCEVNENMSAYSLLKHRHTPEMEQELSVAAGKNVAVSFVPQLGSFSRGIYATITADLVGKMTGKEDIVKIYEKYFDDHPFVFIYRDAPHLKEVRGSNYCHINPMIDERTGRLIVLSTIDNLVKGAAGQAVQCFNLRFRFDQTTGLDLKRGWI